MLGITFCNTWKLKMMIEGNLSEKEVSDKESYFEEWVLEIMKQLANNNNSRVKFYPYRTARVYDEMFDAERESIRPLEYMLAIKAGVNPDNHTVYEVYNGCQTYYVWCTDNLLRVGKTIKLE